MAALRPVTGVARCVFTGTANGQQVVNVFHVQNGGDFGVQYSQTGISALASQLATLYASHFRPHLNSSWSGDQVLCQDLTSITSAFAVAALAGNGAVTGATTPQNAACCVTWKIARRYRGGHPRTYLGPLGAASLENNTSFTSAFQTSVASAANLFLTGVNAIVADGKPQTLVTIHRYKDKAELAVPEVSKVLSVAVDTRIDSMRRRLGPDR